MSVSRRMLFAIGGGAATLAALPALAREPARPSSMDLRGGDRRFAKALAAIRRYAEAELAATGCPGMTIALVGPDGLAATIAVGWADVDRRVAVTPRHWFEIGSISKSLTALTIHRLAERGLVSLDAPVSRYVADAPLPRAPITIRQLLDHTSGLPHDAPVFPRSPDGRLWTGYAPGTRFSYSNIGYTLLGLTIEQATGLPHPAAIEREVLRPIGMTDAAAHLASADRAKYAVGYTPLRTDLPTLTRLPLREGPWTEEDMAAGAVGASGEAMLGYLRCVLALSAGSGAGILKDETARAIFTRDVEAPDFGKDARYTSGFARVMVGGRRVIHHTGGMVLFSSSFHADPQAGVACFASVNASIGNYRPRKTTAFAIEALRAAAEGRALPAAPDPFAFRAIDRPADYAGRWIAADGMVLAFTARARDLVLTADGATGRVEKSDDDVLMTDHPTRASHLLLFDRDGDRIARLWWGGTAFTRGAPAPAIGPAKGLTRYVGRYVSGDPWIGGASIVACGDRLIAEGYGELKRRDGGWWSVMGGDGVETPDRAWFDGDIGTRATRMSFNGMDLRRFV